MRHLKYIIIILIVATATIAKGQLNILFSADTTVVCVGEEIQFSDTTSSASALTQWEWYFGDGTNSTEQNPVHIYSQAGYYDVRLRAGDGSIQNVSTKVNYILVRNSPAASFIIQDSLFSDSYSVIVKAIPSDSLKSSFFWDFGDGNSEIAKEMLHTYSAEGSYTITLIEETGKGCRDTISESISIEDQFEIPDIFTPNNDGMNDVWFVKSNGYTLFNITIYNRWGEVVYRYTTKKVSWDGRTTAGVECPPGPYMYYIESASGESQYTKVGHVFLAREKN